MLNHRGFSAWIVVDGEPLPEYLVAVDSSVHRVSCWIPSEAGKMFSVHWKDHGGGVNTCGYITLDGYMAPGRFLHGEGEAWRGGVRTGPTSERPFVFQRVDENFSSSNDPNTMNKDVGTIVLRIKRVRIAEAATPNAIQQLPGTSGGRNGMRVGFGIEQPTYEQYPSTWKVEGYDNPGSNRPSTYVSFVFRYRTLDFLRAQGIIDDVLPSTSSLHRRQPQRRIASTPIPQNIPSPAANTFIGSAGASTDSVYINLGSRPINTADSRRAVSMQTSFQQEEGQYEVEPVNYPGEGMLIFPTRKTN